MMDRREFLKTGAAAGAALWLPAMARAQDAAPPRPPGATSLWVDAQGGVNGFDEVSPGKYAPAARMVEAIRQRRIDLVSMTLGEVGNGPDRFRSAVESIAMFDRVIGEHPTLLAKVESAADIGAARAAGRVGLVYNFQDTTALEGDAARVATFGALGIKVMQLTYNKRNLAGDGCLERSNAGLSDFGREVIAQIEAQKLLLDLSHAGQRTIAEGIAAAKRPPAITHSGCRDLVDYPRNTYDREMRALAAKGGVFGVYLMPFLRRSGQPQRDDLLRHLDHAVKVCGEDHVGIGTDNPLLGYTIDEESRATHRRFFEDRQKRGVAAPGEAADVMNYVEGYNDGARYDRIAADLRRRGWSSARVDKVLGGNWLRLFGEAWGG
jgi:membrane dipeptidase